MDLVKFVLVGLSLALATSASDGGCSGSGNGSGDYEETACTCLPTSGDGEIPESNCTSLPPPFNSMDCKAARIYILASWGVGGALIIIIVVLLVVVCCLGIARRKENLRSPRKISSEQANNIQRYTKKSEDEIKNTSNSYDIMVDAASTNNHHLPAANVRPSDITTTLTDETYDAIEDVVMPADQGAAATPQIHINNMAGQENYDYVTTKTSNNTSAEKRASSLENDTDQPLPYEDFVRGGEQIDSEQPLPYEDFVHVTAEQKPAATKQRRSEILLESNNGRYSKLIHLPNTDSDSAKPVRASYYNKPGDVNRHSCSHILSSPSNEQEFPPESQYSSLNKARSYSPPPLPPPFDIENDPGFIELRLNVPENNARESYYGNISRKSVDMDEITLHDNEEVLYCNTGPLHQEDGPGDASTGDEGEYEGGDVLYDDPHNTDEVQELYINVKRS